MKKYLNKIQIPANIGKHPKLIVVSAVIFLALSLFAEAQEDILLDYFHQKSGCVFYDRGNIGSEGVRFDLPYPCRIKEIRFRVKGDSGTSAFRMRIFGSEGGSSVPAYENDIAGLVVFRKRQNGIESFSYKPVEYISASSRFFVVLEYSTGSPRLVSDTVERAPYCISESGEKFYNQVMKIDGRWTYGKFSYDIQAIVDNIPPEHVMFTNVTPDLGIDDSLCFNRSMALYDLDDNSFTDLLADGRLYLNNGDFTLREAGDDYGLSGRPGANLFMDINRDGKMDILFLCCPVDTNPAYIIHKAFINRGEGFFSEQVIDILGLYSPLSFSIGDLNRDGWQDMVITQASEKVPNAKNLFILINNKLNGFEDISTGISGLDTSLSISTCSIVDYNKDNYPDIFLVSDMGHFRLIENRAGGELMDVSNSILPDISGFPGDSIYSYGTAADWSDVNSDGLPDLLSPRGFILLNSRPGRKYSPLMLFRNTGVYGRSFDITEGTKSLSPEFQQSAIASDINNDGLRDFIITSGCLCKDPSLYMQGDQGSFHDITHNSGLTNRSLGPDGIIADLNGDGLHDFITTQGGFLRVFRNTCPGPGNYIDFDISAVESWQDTRIIIYSDGRKQFSGICNGRGFLTQMPPGIHFGLGTGDRIDSAIITNGKTIKRLEGISEVNRTYRVDKSGGITGSDASVISARAFPNPFGNEVEFDITLREKGRLKISVFAGDGSEITEIMNDTRDKGACRIKWNGRGRNGEALPSGLYIYTISLNGVKIEGNLIKINRQTL